MNVLATVSETSIKESKRDSIQTIRSEIFLYNVNNLVEDAELRFSFRFPKQYSGLTLLQGMH